MEREVTIPVGERTVRGTLNLPTGASAVVVFAHGSGSGRFSPRNQYVAQVLQKAGLATLLLDLLEEDEADDRSKVFDIALLAGRFRPRRTGWRASRKPKSFGWAILGPVPAPGPHSGRRRHRRNPPAPIVSRGGRPDLAGDVLPRVELPPC